MKAYKKSTFHKLYLIEPELYNRMLPLLNEIDKNELIQLNQEHLEDEISVQDSSYNNIDKNNTESQLESQKMTNEYTQTRNPEENQTTRNIISEPAS